MLPSALAASFTASLRWRLAWMGVTAAAGSRVLGCRRLPGTERSDMPEKKGNDLLQNGKGRSSGPVRVNNQRGGTKRDSQIQWKGKENLV